MSFHNPHPTKYHSGSECSINGLVKSWVLRHMIVNLLQLVPLISGKSEITNRDKTRQAKQTCAEGHRKCLGPREGEAGKHHEAGSINHG